MALQRKEDGLPRAGSRLAPSATAHCSPLRRKCRGLRPPVFRSAWLAVHLLPGARTLRVTDPPLRNSTDPGGAGQGGEDTAPYGQEHRPAGFSAPPQGAVRQHGRVTDPPLRVQDAMPRATSPGTRATHRTKGTARPARRAALSLPVKSPSRFRGPVFPKIVNQL